MHVVCGITQASSLERERGRNHKMTMKNKSSKFSYRILFLILICLVLEGRTFVLKSLLLQKQKPTNWRSFIRKEPKKESGNEHENASPVQEDKRNYIHKNKELYSSTIELIVNRNSSSFATLPVDEGTLENAVAVSRTPEHVLVV